MTELEETRLKLKCMEMVEGTGLKWWEVIKYNLPDNSWVVLDGEPAFDAAPDRYKVALGIVEGKPVWEGDALYFHSDDFNEPLLTKVSKCNTPFTEGCWSWSPPKPKTVMVELDVEDAQWMADSFNSPNPGHPSRVGQACRNALEGQ